jgi:hypothetical protein
MCQPGLPFPQGLSQNGSFSFDFFHKTKSPLFFLSFSVPLLKAPSSKSTGPVGLSNFEGSSFAYVC